jgi:hypothetical protein
VVHVMLAASPSTVSSWFALYVLPVQLQAAVLVWSSV